MTTTLTVLDADAARQTDPLFQPEHHRILGIAPINILWPVV
jgi:hypothetical protein